MNDDNLTWKQVAVRLIAFLTLLLPVLSTWINSQQNKAAIEQHSQVLEQTVQQGQANHQVLTEIKKEQAKQDDQRGN